MKAFVLLFFAARAFAGSVGAGDSGAAKATGFPGAFLGSASLALAADSDYGNKLIDALDVHLAAVGVMTSALEVDDYLDQSVEGASNPKELRAALGREPLDAAKASALLLADALARPRQFRELIEGLEAMKAGVGKQMGTAVRAARGTGDKKLFKSLHAAASLGRDQQPIPYIVAERLSALFDAESVQDGDAVVLGDAAPPEPDAPAAPALRPRAADLTRPARP
jgi:hypothetical protein